MNSCKPAVYARKNWYVSWFINSNAIWLKWFDTNCCKRVSASCKMSSRLFSLQISSYNHVENERKTNLLVNIVQQEYYTFTLNCNVTTDFHYPFVFIVFGVQFNGVTTERFDHCIVFVNFFQYLPAFFTNESFRLIAPMPVMVSTFVTWTKWA